MKHLPKYIIQKSNEYWIIWNTQLHEVVGTYETKEKADQEIKKL